ncbi:astacin-like metalloprotease toxin 5 isoform X1 [Parasteatoda tepidariorum]|uniref:astacin-like metalloprotease toxin 5 isoform X2 n=1 Tax=Parasteatoda tepidariorum TaxID=114398 RepID=UPI00077FCCA8|nr:astacin-like metalloprotease toxin 5 isoform X2 [Parasteatoda tepidariorum]XP_042903676.1 astacin-like metalloprotease toxin 5 isoform X1 [Parasteatoda tepidariorum]
MVVLKYIFLIIGLASTCYGRSIDDVAGDEAMQNPDLFEGDIAGFDPHTDRNAVVEKHRVWPNGKIPYIIDPALKEKEPQIKEAMKHYADKTCIRFVPRTDERQYVKIFAGRGCYSHVGKTLGEQPLSLGAGCFKMGTLLHEMGHTVGFFHEHSRSDRDDYLNIHYENIQKGMEDQFVKLRPKQNQLLSPFDFDSVMLYGETVFSKSHYDGLKTMTAKDGRKIVDVNDKFALSKDDILRISKLYQC